MTCCCSLRLLYKVHAIKLDLQSQLHQVVLLIFLVTHRLNYQRNIISRQNTAASVSRLSSIKMSSIFSLNKAIHRMFFGSLVMIITNLPPATHEASRSHHLFISDLLQSFYCFEYNFVAIVTLYFHKNLMVNDKLQDRKWLLAYN